MIVIKPTNQEACITSRSRMSYSKSHVAILPSDQSSSLVCFSSQHPPTAPHLRDRAIIDLFVLMELRSQISYSYCASCFPCEWFTPTAILDIFDELSTSRDSQASNMLNSEQWISVLKLSTLWQFLNIRGRAIKALGLPFIDIQDMEMEHGEITLAIYKDRILLEREFPPPSMLDLIRRRVGQDEDIYLAAISIFTSSGNLKWRPSCKARGIYEFFFFKKSPSPLTNTVTLTWMWPPGRNLSIPSQHTATSTRRQVSATPSWLRQTTVGGWRPPLL